MATTPIDPNQPVPEPLVLFDGECGMCEKGIHFILDHENGNALHFAPLQSELGQRIIAGDPSVQGLDSVIFVEGGRCSAKSTAALCIARYLRTPWNWVRVGWILPRPIRDFAYDFVAKRRHRWFGAPSQCRMMTPDLRKRFVA